MHIDVNNAFLSWSAIDLLRHGYKYDIRYSYAVIGGDENKRYGIVLAKSNPAKKKGIVTAETLYSARKKCPNLQIYPPNYKWYKYMSNKLFKLLSNYTPDIEIFSIDECFLDYTPIYHIHKDPIKFAYKLKKEIKDTLGFTVNIGIANNKLCAKMASDFSKPDKVHTLFNNEITTKMFPLEINELFGVGKKTSQKLKNLGINTIGDLAKTDPVKLHKHFKNQTIPLIEKANGIDNSPVISYNEATKGLSNSTTLERNLNYKEEIYPILHAIADNLGIQLRNQKRYAYVIGVILKNKDFKNYSHQTKLMNATNNTEEIYEISKQLLNEMWEDEPIRLVGIKLDNLVDTTYHQVSLFEDITDHEKNNELNKVVDELKEKYGTKIINKATLIDNQIKKKY